MTARLGKGRSCPVPGEQPTQHPKINQGSYLARVDAPGQVAGTEHAAGVQLGPQGPFAGVSAEQGHSGLSHRLSLRPVYREAGEGAQAWRAGASRRRFPLPPPSLIPPPLQDQTAFCKGVQPWVRFPTPGLPKLHHPSPPFFPLTLAAHLGPGLPHTFEEGPPARDGASGAGWGLPGPLGQAHRAHCPCPCPAHRRPQLHQGQVVVEGPRVKLRRGWRRSVSEAWGGGAVPNSESLGAALSPWGGARCGSPAPPPLAPPQSPRPASPSTEARSGRCGTSGGVMRRTRVKRVP